MKELLGVALTVFIIIATITFTQIVGNLVFSMRDCELSSGEECVWVVVPVSQTH